MLEFQNKTTQLQATTRFQGLNGFDHGTIGHGLIWKDKLHVLQRSKAQVMAGGGGVWPAKVEERGGGTS